MIPVSAKSVFRQRVVPVLGARLLRLYVFLSRKSNRVEVIKIPVVKEIEVSGKGAIILFWHERLMLAPIMAFHTYKHVNMLSSTHRDSDIIVNGIRLPNLSFIRGSAANPKKPEKDKQGAWALYQIIGALRKGDIVSITPDGPRGPARKIQPGVVELAARAGVPIIPFGLSAKSGKHLKSWDKLFLANPFSRKLIISGAPITIPKEANPDEMDQFRNEVEAALNEVTLLADKKVGK